MWLDMWTNVCIFESSKLESLYVEDLLYVEIIMQEFPLRSLK